MAFTAQAAYQRQICASQLENQTTQYLWHGGMIDAEIQNGQVTKRYIFINLRPVAVIEYENDSTPGNKYAGYSPKNTPKSTAIYAIHTDHLGTPQAITDNQQAIAWRADYATFGKATVQAKVVDSKIKTASNGIISTANAATNAAKLFEFNLRFAGQYEDTESGYHYNWHRYYDPSTGRYLTPDPIGLAGGLNGYGYAGQDPMGSVDPWGLYTLVIYNGPTSGNPFGHTAIATTGSGVYSPGNNPNAPNRNYAGSSVTDYLQTEVVRRDSSLYILDTTPEQEKAIIDYMKSKNSTPNMFPDNCASRVGDALRAGGVILVDPIIPGVSLPTAPFPSTIARALDKKVADGEAYGIHLPRNSTIPAALETFNPK